MTSSVAESPGDLLRALTECRDNLRLWLGRRDDDLILDVLRQLARRTLLIEQQGQLAQVNAAPTGSRIRERFAQIRRTRRLLDRVVTYGLERRVGWRLGLEDRKLLVYLGELGAGNPTGGVAVCRDCMTVFRPARKSEAKRCDECHRHPPPALKVSDDSVELAEPRFDRPRDQVLAELAGLARPITGPKFTGWTTLRIVKCRECGLYFQAKRRAVTCSNECRTARSRDGRARTDRLGPAAQELRDEVERQREVFDAAVCAGDVCPDPLWS